jgi:hypothetical protein
MGTTSNQAKERWNNSHYTQVKVSVQPEIAAKFKAKCQTKGVSMASELSRFMSGDNKRDKPKDISSTRQKRRKALVEVITQLEEICYAEKDYWDNIPINLQNGERYEAAEQAYSAMEEALALLYQAY